MSEVSLGTVYDINKNLMDKEKRLSNSALRKKIDEIDKDFFKKGYFMLLCHEQRDYTVFDITTDANAGWAARELKDCLSNRGDVLSIEKTQDGIAYEIWIRKTEGSFVYYLFPYDEAVIVC